MLVPSPGGCNSWGRIQQPETPSRSPSWYQEYMYLGHHPPLSLSSLARSWIRRQTPRIRVSTPMWDASIESSLLTFCTMMSPNWIQTCILSNTTKKKWWLWKWMLWTVICDRCSILRDCLWWQQFIWAPVQVWLALLLIWFLTYAPGVAVEDEPSALTPDPMLLPLAWPLWPSRQWRSSWKTDSLSHPLSFVCVCFCLPL